jgi:hypothetical protein
MNQATRLFEFMKRNGGAWMRVRGVRFRIVSIDTIDDMRGRYLEVEGVHHGRRDRIPVKHIADGKRGMATMESSKECAVRLGPAWSFRVKDNAIRFSGHKVSRWVEKLDLNIPPGYEPVRVM